MENTVTITKAQAEALKRILDDVMNIDRYARCSDKFFRTHFMDMIKTTNASGVYAELKKALEGDVHAWS